MAIVRATAVLSSLTGRQEDECRNVWHFEVQGDFSDDGDLVNIGEGLRDFYAAQAIRLSPTVNRAIGAFRVELADVDPGAPGRSDDKVSKLRGTIKNTTAFAASTNTTPLPAEVALCLSFRGDLTGVPEEALGGLERPASRRRGRIFLGPLSAGMVVSEAGTNRAIPASGTLTNIINDYGTMLAAINGAGQATNKARHVIYSRRNGTTYPVVEVSIDDAFDTQRRRGERRVGKTTQVITQAPPS